MLLELQTENAWIISVFANDKLDEMLFVFVTYSEVQKNTKRTKYVLTFTISYEQIQEQCDGQVARHAGGRAHDFR